MGARPVVTLEVVPRSSKSDPTRTPPDVGPYTMPRGLIPAGLSFVLLAAHFLRVGNIPIVAGMLVCILLLTKRSPWAKIVLQTVLVLGVVQWLLTLGGIAAIRLGNGEPWIRMALILGTVTVFTGYAAWHLNHPSVRAWFERPASETDGGS